MRAKARQIRLTADCDIPVAFAIERVDQCVASTGDCSSVFTITRAHRHISLINEPTLYIVCERCSLVLDPDEPDSVHAVERKDVAGFGAESPEYVDGVQVSFHEGCDPGEPHYPRFTV